MKTKPGKVITLYENVSQTQENQTFVKTVRELEKNFKVKIEEVVLEADSVNNDVIEAARKLR